MLGKCQNAICVTHIRSKMKGNLDFGACNDTDSVVIVLRGSTKKCLYKFAVKVQLQCILLFCKEVKHKLPAKSYRLTSMQTFLSLLWLNRKKILQPYSQMLLKTISEEWTLLKCWCMCAYCPSSQVGVRAVKKSVTKCYGCLSLFRTILFLCKYMTTFAITWTFY